MAVVITTVGEGEVWSTSRESESPYQEEVRLVGCVFQELLTWLGSACLGSQTRWNSEMGDNIKRRCPLM